MMANFCQQQIQNPDSRFLNRRAINVGELKLARNYAGIGSQLLARVLIFFLASLSSPL